MAEIAKLPAILYLYTGKQEYLKFAQAAQRRIFDHHMLIRRRAFDVGMVPHSKLL